MLKLLRAMLRAGVMESGTVRHPVTGTPQGGPLSPLLCNVYLHRLDRVWDSREHGVLIRFADDALVMCKSRAQAEAALARLRTVLADLGLELKEAKTRIVHLQVDGQGFDFLGFDANGGYANAPVDDLNWSDKLGHYRLAEYLRRKLRFRWILSYDAESSLLTDRALYAASRMTPSAEDKITLGVREWTITKRLVTLRYTASARKGRGPADELLLTTFPPSTVPSDAEFRPLRPE